MVLVRDLDLFDFEDRKQVQYVVTELHSNCKESIEQALSGGCTRTVEILLKKYGNHEMASFIGTYLRLFIDSKQLSKGWM